MIINTDKQIPLKIEVSLIISTYIWYLSILKVSLLISTYILYLNILAAVYFENILCM